MNARIGAAALVVLGLAQMAGDLAGLPTLKGLAAATAASPAPKVFSAHRGLETYSTRFYLEWTGADGAPRRALLTPERGAGLRGPYNRRNVYGAVLSYGPVLLSDPKTRPMFESVARRALCSEAPLLKELGLEPPPAGAVTVVLETRPDRPQPDLPLRFTPECGAGAAP